MQNKKIVAIILLTLFLVIPLAHANDWGISKDWTFADPNKPIIVIPTDTPTPTINSTVTSTAQENITSTTSPSPDSTPSQNGQTPTATSNPTTTPFLPYKISFPTTTIIIIALIALVILIVGILLLKKIRHKGEKEPWQRYT